MEISDYDFKSKFNDSYNVTTRKIVRTLSENSRISISELLKSVGESRMTVRNRLKRIEDEFDISYTAELNENLIKVASQHIISVKFDTKPDFDKIKNILQNSYIPQLAFTVRGGYDMFIYAISTSTKEYAHWDRSMQILLSEYGTEWKPSEVVHRHLGFCPMRSKLLDRLDIPENYKGILKILNKDARTPFRKISRDLKMHFNTVAYNFNKLMDEGYIKRFTITINKSENLKFLAFFSKFKPQQDFEKSSSIARKLIMKDDKDPLVNRTILSANLIGSYDLFIMGAFDNYDAAYKNYLLPYKKIYSPQGIRTTSGEVDKVILGKLPVRSIDTTKEYKTIVWNPHFEEHN